jgi:hypothetical protein
VNHCLEKNPEARFHSARDITFALEALSGSTVTTPDEIPTDRSLPLQRQRVGWSPWAVAAGALLLAALALAWQYFRRSPTAEVSEAIRFVIPMPEKSLILGPPLSLQMVDESSIASIPKTAKIFSGYARSARWKRGLWLELMAHFSRSGQLTVARSDSSPILN